jgi:hypothetical protein
MPQWRTFSLSYTAKKYSRYFKMIIYLAHLSLFFWFISQRIKLDSPQYLKPNSASSSQN